MKNQSPFDQDPITDQSQGDQRSIKSRSRFDPPFQLQFDHDLIKNQSPSDQDPITVLSQSDQFKSRSDQDSIAISSQSNLPYCCSMGAFDLTLFLRFDDKELIMV